MPSRKRAFRRVPWTPPLTNQQTVTKSGLLTAPHPYRTVGGKVPLYLVSHGRVQKRDWVFRTPEWCELCREPVAVWVNHMSRKDHALLDQHYSALVEWPRRWDPQVLLQTFLEEAGLDLGEAHAVYARHDQERRTELHALLLELHRAGMLDFGESRYTYLSRMHGGLRGMDHQGALVLYEALIGPFMRLFPDGHIQDFSNLLDFCTCSYNMETVYDLCAMYALDDVARRADYGATSPAALGLGGIAASAGATQGYERPAEVVKEQQQQQLSAAERHARALQSRRQESLEEEAFSRKAQFMRQVLGQLRFLQLPGQRHPAGFTFPEHVLALGEVALKSLVAEVISARLSEYMVRAEPVWRACGFERRVPKEREQQQQQDATLAQEGDGAAAISTEPVLPEPVVYTYRRMARDHSDLYSVSEATATGLDADVAAALRAKGLPVPPEYLPKRQRDDKIQ